MGAYEKAVNAFIDALAVESAVGGGHLLTP